MSAKHASERNAVGLQVWLQIHPLTSKCVEGPLSVLTHQYLLCVSDGSQASQEVRRLHVEVTVD